MGLKNRLSLRQNVDMMRDMPCCGGSEAIQRTEWASDAHAMSQSQLESYAFFTSLHVVAVFEICSESGSENLLFGLTLN